MIVFYVIIVIFFLNVNKFACEQLFFLKQNRSASLQDVDLNFSQYKKKTDMHLYKM